MSLYLLDTIASQTCNPREKVLEELKQEKLDFEKHSLETITSILSEDLINPILLILFDESLDTRNLEDKVKLIREGSYGDLQIVPFSLGEIKYISSDSLGEIKAYRFCDENTLKNTILWIKSFLGLGIIPKKNNIFISYRATDLGKKHAEGIEAALEKKGFNIWRDESRDEDHEGKLTIGQSVQEEIKKSLKNSSLVLLVDTPCAPESKWVRDEINTAVSNLIPVLPVVFKNGTDLATGTRFRALMEIQRSVIKNDTDQNYDDVLNYLESFLASLYKVKVHIPAKVSRLFLHREYDWKLLPDLKTLYLSTKQKKYSKNSVISQLPIYESFYSKAINRLIKYIGSSDQVFNYRVFIYTGSQLSKDEKEALIDSNLDISSKDIALLHHQELEGFLSEI